MTKRNKNDKVLGCGTHPNMRSFHHPRHGLMDEIPYNKLIRGVIIIRTDDLGRVTEFLEQHSAEYHVRVVELTEGDREVMGASVE